MPIKDDRLDAEPFRPGGSPLPIGQLLDLATVTPQDVEAALDLTKEAYPPRFQELLE